MDDLCLGMGLVEACLVKACLVEASLFSLVAVAVGSIYRATMSE